MLFIAKRKCKWNEHQESDHDDLFIYAQIATASVLGLAADIVKVMACHLTLNNAVGFASYILYEIFVYVIAYLALISGLVECALASRTFCLKARDKVEARHTDREEHAVNA